MPDSLEALRESIDQAMAQDRRPLRRRLDGLRRRQREGKPIDRGSEALAQAVAASVARRQRRHAALPQPTYPEELPVSARRAAIAAALEEHQVVVVAGETGSGKTTQLPKICLELGRGVDGFIGHTQPRRIAARSVATRIAEELKSPLGEAVGYKVRFSDHTSAESYIKLMTDGILLAEAQHDPLLSQYDTLIIDEAHERSLNIDFLLGYLKQLLPRRPDLKLIITSATIDTERFARHFGAPVIEVTGRTYPVEMRYRPLGGEEEERDQDLPQAILAAVEEASRLEPLGDILVFLSGEREIRECAETLRKRGLRNTEVLPLFARLTAQEQNRVFQSHAGRRIVLSTNVAETSLTVPGIRFVIDTGFARISRYSHRTKVQRLPIEAISQASANQRAGRCGRLGPGVCFRLYSEEDFLGRPEFTEPEILRTNLASVILQMKLLGLGEIEAFPFVEPPDRRFINDGYRVLHELGALDEHGALSETGKQLGRLPVDPRIGRMVLAARQTGALREVLVIASALSVQEPRERPMEAQQPADEKHKLFSDERSDFLGYLNLWNAFHEQKRHLSQRKLRQWCREHFISYLRMREWHDIHAQLTTHIKSLGLQQNELEAEYEAIHRALLTGLLSQAAVKEEPGEKKAQGEKRGKGRPPATLYLGARNVKLNIFPGSALAKKSPKWIMAGELVETSRLFARTVAGIHPEWLEQLGAHLLKRSYSEPHWEKKAGQVAAFEQVTLYGLIVVPRRKVNYGPLDPVLSRELFIRHALVEGDFRCTAPFFRHNRELLEAVESLEAKSRRRDLLVDEQVLFDFYDERLPQGLYSAARFERWRKQAERETPQLLFLTRDYLMRHGAEEVTVERFPDAMAVNSLRLALDYHFEPGHPDDGVTAVVPVAALNQLAGEPFDYLVPGLLEEKVTALIRSLPKALRKNFVPAPDFAAACVSALKGREAPLLEALTHQLKRMSGITVPPEAWQPQTLPLHLQMNFRVVDADGKPLDAGRDLAALRARLGGKAQESLRRAPGEGYERSGITAWDFGALPPTLTLEQAGMTLQGYPALADEGESVAIRVFDTAQKAQVSMRAGLRRLFILQNAQPLRYLRRNLPGIDRMCLHYAPLGKCEELREALVTAVLDTALFSDGELPRDADAFTRLGEAVRPKLAGIGNALCGAVGEALAAYHDVAKQMKGNISPAWLNALADIRQQLDHLIFPGFVQATPHQWLQQLPRYLKAAQLRLEKLRQSADRDRIKQNELAPLWKQYLERVDNKPGACGDDEELQLYRWMLEEFRISLFAQEIKTLMPVSAKRLQAQWKRVGQ